jgi:hypothetical protein
MCSRTSATCSDSSACGAGASPRQNGIVGAAPCASSTSTRPAADAADSPGRVAEQHDVAGQALDGEVLVHRADDGLSGSATTVYNAVSGIAPPPVIAASARSAAGAQRLSSPGRGEGTRPYRPRLRRDAVGQHVEQSLRIRRAPSARYGIRAP